MIRRQQEFTKSSLPGCLAAAVSPSGEDDFAPVASADRSASANVQPMWRKYTSSYPVAAGTEPRSFPVVACPTPTSVPVLTPPASARQRGPSPRDAWQHPFGPCPRERESLGRGMTKERAMTKE